VLSEARKENNMTTKNRRKDGELLFRFLLTTTLPLFFVTTLVNRAMPWNWGRDKRSIFAATRCAAYNSIPFAFM
jgi:hypothetical protein